MKFLVKYSAVLVFLTLPIWLSAQNNFDRANKHHELHSYQLAIKSYQKVLDKEPNNGEALSKMGDCLYHLNRMNEAQQFFEKAIATKNMPYNYMLTYAKTLMSLSNYDGAKRWFQFYGEGFPSIGNHYSEACEIAKNRVSEAPIFQVSKTDINTNASDFGATFYKDKVVYSSSRRDLKRAQEKKKSDMQNQLFIATNNKQGQLYNPVFLKNVLSNNYNEGPVSFSADGRWVAYTKNNFLEGTRQIPSSGAELSLYIAEVSPEGYWKNAKAFPFNSSDWSTAYPSFSNDGTTLYFASDRPDGMGGFDIYVSTKIGDNWSIPTNVGAPINTQGDEISPYFNGQSLYFASDWHAGFGGFDIFRAEQGNGKWERIFHQGTGVNTAYDDYNFIYDPTQNIGYFTSNRKNNKGHEDIYIVSKVTEKFTLKIMDEAGRPLSAVLLDFSACGERVVSTNPNGEFAFQAASGFDCTITAEKENFVSQNIRIKSDGYPTSKTIEINLKKPGATTVISTVPSPSNNIPPQPSNNNNANTSTSNNNTNIPTTSTNNTGNNNTSPPTTIPTNTTPNNTNNGNSGTVSTPPKNTTTPTTTTTAPPTSVPNNQNNAERASYIGKVVLSGSTNEVKNVKIRATNQKDNSTQEVWSDVEGNYTLAMLPNSTYIVHFSKANYADINRIVHTKNGNDRSILDITFLKSSTTASVPTTPTPAPSNPPTPAPSKDNLVSKGYAIQVSAIGRNQTYAAKDYRSLERYGNVYLKEEGAHKKIRVGIYSTISEANAVRQQILRAGYKGAFVINDSSQGSSSKEYEKSPNDQNTKPTNNTSKQQYYIRLGAYRNPQLFNKKPLQAYGEYTNYRKGDFTIILLKVNGTKNRANSIRQKAIQSGFNGAYLVTKNSDGSFVRMR